MVELLDRDDQPQVINLRNANGSAKNRRRRDVSVSAAASTDDDGTDIDDDTSSSSPNTTKNTKTTTTTNRKTTNPRRRPLIYDRDLNHLADAFADRMLHHGQAFDDDSIRDILQASGIEAVTVGSAWGYTNLHDGDALEAYVAQKHPEISEDDAYTHYALGFSKAAAGNEIEKDDTDDDNDEGRERNMYMFLAVSYEEEERHLAHHSTAVPPAFEVHSPEEHNDVAFAVLGMVNQMRMSAGLSPLSLDNKALQRAAQWYSNDMLIHGYPTQREGGVPHIGTDGSTAEDRAEREGYKPLAVRENILSRFDMSAQGAFEQWWDSPGHRSNMMADDVTHMSLAVTCDVETGQYYYTQLFGRPFVEVQPDDLVGPLVNKLQLSCAQMNKIPFRPNPVLMDYAGILAPYVSQHGELPSNTWDNIESRYAYDEITAVVAWTPYDDPDETMRYLAKTYEEQLNNPAYTEIGVGVHCDTVSGSWAECFLKEKNGMRILYQEIDPLTFLLFILHFTLQESKLYYNVVVLARPQGEKAVMPDDHRHTTNGRQRHSQGPQVIFPRGRHDFEPEIMHEYADMGSNRARPRSRNTIGEENMETFASNLGDKLTPDSKVY